MIIFIWLRYLRDLEGRHFHLKCIYAVHNYKIANNRTIQFILNKINKYNEKITVLNKRIINLLNLLN